jgi:sarcosine oxidase gamma subunit
MSNPVSALNGASFQGFASIREIGPLGMITLRAKGVKALDKAADVLRKLSPVDFDTLEPGELRRTRTAQVAAALWQQDKGYTLVCFRSVATYVMGLLSHSAQPGSEL